MITLLDIAAQWKSFELRNILWYLVPEEHAMCERKCSVLSLSSSFFFNFFFHFILRVVLLNYIYGDTTLRLIGLLMSIGDHSCVLLSSNYVFQCAVSYSSQ